MQVAISPHLEAITNVKSSVFAPALPSKVERLAWMLPAFKTRYAALGSIFISRPTSNTRKIQFRITGAVSARPRRASANHEPPNPSEETAEERPGIKLDICGAQIHPPTTRKPPRKAATGTRMRLKISPITFQNPVA